MQCRIFLLAVSFSLSTIVSAQPSRVLKTDTLIIKTVRDQNKPTPILVTAKQAVPLAGHKAYFGPMNDYVVNYTRKYMSSHNKTLSVVKDRSTKRFTLMDNVLKKHNIPVELKYLAVIESALNNNATSPVGAVGPWQFMESTARLMGLTVSSKRDDRTDWFKSTNAAAKYLNYLYGELNDWLLVVAAYNSGPTPIRRAMAKTGSSSFWEIKKYLPRETQGHVLAFIATASIFENLNKFIGSSIPSDFSFYKEEKLEEKKALPKIVFTDEELKSMAIVRISEPLNMDLLSQDLKIEKRLLEKWNLDFDNFELDAYVGDFYSLRIPKEKLDNFIDRKEFLTKRSRVMFTEARL